MDHKRLERIEKKIDDGNDHLASIDITLAEQHISLREHMRRTALIEQDLKPIKNHVAMMNAAAKIITIVGGMMALYKYFG